MNASNSPIDIDTTQSYEQPDILPIMSGEYCFDHITEQTFDEVANLIAEIFNKKGYLERTFQLTSPQVRF